MEPDDAERERMRQEFLMQARAVRINQRKLARRGIIDEDEAISDCAPHLTTQQRTTRDPYRQLDMQAYGGAPLMQSAQRTAQEILTESEDDIDEEICTPSTPRRKIKTAWTEVQTFCKITMEVSQINRAVDEIMEKLLRDAGFRSEHVSHTKATDRMYWKSAHISDARKSVSLKFVFENRWHYSDFVLVLVCSRTAAARIPRNTMSFFSVHARIYVVAQFNSKFGPQDFSLPAGRGTDAPGTVTGRRSSYSGG